MVTSRWETAWQGTFSRWRWLWETTFFQRLRPRWTKIWPVKLLTQKVLQRGQRSSSPKKPRKTWGRAQCHSINQQQRRHKKTWWKHSQSPQSRNKPLKNPHNLNWSCKDSNNLPLMTVARNFSNTVFPNNKLKTSKQQVLSNGQMS